MTPPSLAKLDVSDAGKLVLVIGASSMVGENELYSSLDR